MAMPRKWPRCYYTYVMYDRRTGVPFYVGAGKNNRCNPKRKKITEELRSNTLVIVIEHDSKEEAFADEVVLTKKFGRRDLGTGSLMNLTDGRGSRGRPRSEDERKRIGAPRVGVPLSDETRKKMSKARMGNTYLLGYRHSDEAKRRQSEASKAMWARRKKCG